MRRIFYERHNDDARKSRPRRVLGRWIRNSKHLWPLYDMPYRYITSPARSLPDWYIIGAPKCGTTSLHDYIIQHPDIDPCMSKEPCYYNGWYDYGQYYYRAQFPSRSRGRITGESTTSYLAHPLVAQRMHSLTPHAKIIVMVRNPADRAYSQYHMMRRSEVETAPTFEVALTYEEQRQREYERGDMNEHIWHMYRGNGMYAYHLTRWHPYFPVDKMLIINYDDFASRPQSVLDRVWNHLGVRPLHIPARRPLNVGKYPPMRQDTRDELIEYFRPHNKQLSHLIKQKFDWM